MARYQFVLTLSLLVGTSAFHSPTFRPSYSAHPLRSSRHHSGAILKSTVDDDAEAHKQTTVNADKAVAPNDAGAAAAVAAAASAAASAAEAAALAAQAAAAAVAALPFGATATSSVVPCSTVKGKSAKVSENFQDLIQSTWVKRLAVWVPALALCAFMRPFYPILLGTYVLTLIGKQMVEVLERVFKWTQNKVTPIVAKRCPSFYKLWCMKVPRWLRYPPRKLFCAAYIFGTVAMLVGFTVTTLPEVVKEGRFVVQRVAQSGDPYVYVATALHDVLGDDGTRRLETFLASQASATSLSDQIFGSKRQEDMVAAAVAAGTWSAERANHLGLLLQDLLKQNVLGMLNGARLVLDTASGALVQASAALLFSFLLVFDLPAIAKGVRSLQHSKLRYAYHEVTPKIVNFSTVFGTAFECTVIMAVVNTALTYIGMAFLKLPAAFFLSLLVFLSSFIPVIGILLSTGPMALVALNEFGVHKMFEVVGMVAGVHAFEAWALYPLIYANKLKLHPLLVLVSLYVTEHLFGVQGLVLAVPVTACLLKVLMKDSNEKALESADAAQGSSANFRPA